MADSVVVEDHDPAETEEWLDALASVAEYSGQERAAYLLSRLNERLGAGGGSLNTPYCNSIYVDAQPDYPGDLALEAKLEALMRWNTAVTVAGANKADGSLGGHIGTYASSCTVLEVGFNHFFRAPSKDFPGDCIFFQGHGSPGIYARSFLEGRITESQMQHFRRETAGKGLSSYPHPWLMPDYWQFPTVSMGLGPMGAIYQARFLKYLHHRGLSDTASERKVYAFCGDGEMDEPESMGAITRAGREKLDNLIFVINCNLQRLDGLVNGNGKIMQELESSFHGAGWRVIKVVWGSNWDALFARDTDGVLLKHLSQACDGDFQTYQSRGPAYMREHFFGQDPALAALVADMSDEDIANLHRGGHDPVKVFAAYHAAVNHTGQPVVILTKTVKGYGLSGGESRNIAHNQKKLKADELADLRDRFEVDVSDAKLADYKRVKPAKTAPEIQYLHERRKALGGYIPTRLVSKEKLKIPHYRDFAKRLLQGSGEREQSTTTAFVQILGALAKDKAIGERVVPITPDESRTFGMEGLFRQLGIYNAAGQRYEPEDRSQVMYYKEAKDGQILQEGINEGGAFSAWIAAATSYSVHQIPMIPIYIYYSMFGFQRIGDYAWLAGDMRARGFLIGATSGRTTLNGEGLQHEDGHSHIMAGLIPNVRSYDPTFSYELAVIMHRGMQEMYVDQQDVYYYITTMNENYLHPAMPEDSEEAIIKGLYQLPMPGKQGKPVVQLMGSGSILLEVLEAQALLKKDFKLSAAVWSMTSANELYRDAKAAAHWNRLNPGKKPRVPYVTDVLSGAAGPVVVATDYVASYIEPLRAFIPNHLEVLGTDGYGRSDTRAALRAHFEVDRYHIVLSALTGLVSTGKAKPDVLKQAIKKYGLDSNKPNPMTV